jgi:His-Xaa-Ser system protein HxsD
MELVLDESVFSLDVVTRASHRYSRDFWVELSRGTGGLHLRLQPRQDSVDVACLEQRVRNDLLDERLRAAVRSSTDALRDVLVEAALGHARPGHRRP